MDKKLSRPFTGETRWLICVWDIRGEQPIETARMMRRPLTEIEQTLNRAKEDGYYQMVQRYLDDYDTTNARAALEAMTSLISVVKEKEWARGIKETRDVDKRMREGRKCE